MGIGGERVGHAAPDAASSLNILEIGPLKRLFGASLPVTGQSSRPPIPLSCNDEMYSVQKCRLSES